MAESIVDKTKPEMTHRERFRRQMHYQTVDRGVHWEFGYLAETVQRWEKEGMPKILRGEGPFSVEQLFGVDPSLSIPVHFGFLPPFEGTVKILEEKVGSRTEQYPDGTILEQRTEGIKTIPHFIKFPIANRDDWKRFKERLDPATPERVLVNLKTFDQRARLSNVPVGIALGSFYGTPRNLIGFEQISMMLYDDPDLVEDIVETFTRLSETILEKTLREVEVDYAGGWEDICFRNGPMISPAMFRSLVAPRVKRVCDLLRLHGVDVIWTDCDGNINDLVPIWLECGLNCMFPLEVQGGTDPVVLRKKYGRQILLRGGIAKYQLAHGKKEILAELKRVEKIFEEGGYIPGLDHRCPEDIPYANYQYYIREKLAMLGWAKEDVEAVDSFKPW